MKSEKDLTIIVNFFNEYAFFKEALLSVFAEGIQSLQVIVVNDNPSKGAREFLNQTCDGWPVQVIHNSENLGLSESRNVGIRAALGRYVGFLDADDLYLDGGLTAMLAQALSTQSELVHAPFLHATGRYGLGGEARSWLNILDRTEFQHISSPATFAQVPSLQLIVAPWKFLHKVEYLRENRIEFEPALRKFEDRPFVLSNLLAGGVISFCKVPSRIWRARPGSISSSEKRNDELELALQSVERCVQIVEESIEADGASRICLARELAHSLHRVTVSTQILQLANTGFLDFRERLVAMFSKARSFEEFVDDKVIANRTTAMRQQLGFTKKDVLDLHASLMEGDFEATQHFERHIRK